MKRRGCTVTVALSAEEQLLLESLSKRSKLASSELVRMLLFESGILAAAGRKEH